MVLCTTHRIEENCSFLSDVELYKASNDKLRAKLSPMILGKYIVGTPPEKKLPKEINISEAMRSAVAKKVGEKNIEVDLFKPAHEEIQTLRKMPWGMHNALSPGRYSPQLLNKNRPLNVEQDELLERYDVLNEFSAHRPQFEGCPIENRSRAYPSLLMQKYNWHVICQLRSGDNKHIPHQSGSPSCSGLVNLWTARVRQLNA